MDVIVHDGLERLLVDVVVVSAYAGDANFRANCARRDGFAARRATMVKRARYPTNGLVPFAVETGGRLSTEARAFIVRMAGAAENRTTELQYLYRAISSVLQDGVARQLLKATSGQGTSLPCGPAFRLSCSLGRFWGFFCQPPG